MQLVNFSTLKRGFLHCSIAGCNLESCNGKNRQSILYCLSPPLNLCLKLLLLNVLLSLLLANCKPILDLGQMPLAISGHIEPLAPSIPAHWLVNFAIAFSQNSLAIVKLKKSNGSESQVSFAARDSPPLCLGMLPLLLPLHLNSSLDLLISCIVEFAFASSSHSYFISF